MNCKNFKLLLFITVAMIVFSTTAAGQATSTNNTLGTTGITAIQSTTNTNYKLVVGGAVKVFGTGSNGLSSASLYIYNTATRGRYYINSDNAGALRFMDSVYTVPRLIIDSAGKIGTGIAVPTAFFHLKAGTAAANTAALKFTSGPPTTTPEIGAMHFNNGLLMLDSSNTIRDTLATRSWARRNIVAGGGTVGVANGGTGLTTLTSGDLLYSSATNTFSKLNIGTAGQVLTVFNGAPAWQTPATGGSTQWVTTGSHIYYNTGNVGIGNTAPIYKLDVTGTTRLSTDALINSLTIGKGTGTNNATSTALGVGVLGAGTTGYGNTAIGYQSMFSNTEGFQNVAVGTQAMYSTTGTAGTGYQNTAVGYTALYSNTTGNNNTATGIQSMYYNTTGTFNTAYGSASLRANTTGINNTALGVNAMLKNTTGNWNTAVGYTALNENINGTSNTAIGWQALFANTAINNTAVGRDALTYNTTGTNNTAVGTSALYSSGTGNNNTALGTIALQNTNLGIANTGSGVASLQFNTSGNHNSAFGHYSGNDLISGEYNVFLGSNSGRGITTGSYNTILGSQVTGLPSTLSNNIIIADGQGNRRINVDATGNTGIGINTPTAQLHTTGTVRFAGLTNDNSINRIIATDINGNLYYRDAGTLNGVTGWGLTGNASTSTATNFIGTTDFMGLAIRTANIEQMRITENGNVGIGTNSPRYKLDLARIGADSQDDFIALGVSNGPAVGSSTAMGGGIVWQANYPGYTKRSAGIVQTAEANSFRAGLAFFTNGNNDATTDWSERMRITKDGNIGIGTTTPTEKLDVAGNLKFSGALMPNNNAGTAGQVLTSAGNGLPPVWQAVAASSSQTPWTSNIDGGQYKLSNVKQLEVKVESVAGENLAIRSEELNNTTAWPLSNGAVVANQANDLLGNLTMEEISGSIYGSSATSQTVTVSPSTTYYLSWDVARKPGSILTDVTWSIYDFTHFAPIIGPTSYYSSTSTAVSRIQRSFTTPAGCTSIKIAPFGENNQNGSIYIGRVQLSTTAAAAYVATTTTAYQGTGGTNYALVTDNNGNVGMGTITPTEKLDVAGNIYSNGKILIGTAGLNTGTHSLAVNGSAIFTKAVVKLTTAPWPDFVFQKNYQLPSLHSLEAFIKTNNHLPDVPSAAEVQTNGIDLGNNQSVLLKKVEELTLYMIELNKKVEALAKENEELKKKITTVKK